MQVMQIICQAHAERASHLHPSDALIYCSECHAYTALYRVHKRTSKPISKTDPKVR